MFELRIWSQPLASWGLEDFMATEHKKKCEHPSCTCQISSEDKYCSAQCAAMEDVIDIDCRCAHTACAGKAH
jgi:hypothetical protein